MTILEIIALAAVVVWTIVIEAQIVDIKRTIRRKEIIRMSVQRVTATRIKELREMIYIIAGLKEQEADSDDDN